MSEKWQQTCGTGIGIKNERGRTEKEKREKKKRGRKKRGRKEDIDTNHSRINTLTFISCH